MNINEKYNYAYKFLKENYDYLWLKSRVLLGKQNNNNVTTLITGSSHALNGIDVNCFNGAINCSMHTQDLYYDYACAKEILKEKNNNFKKPNKYIFKIRFSH